MSRKLSQELSMCSKDFCSPPLALESTYALRGSKLHHIWKQHGNQHIMYHFGAASMKFTPNCGYSFIIVVTLGFMYCARDNPDEWDEWARQAWRI